MSYDVCACCRASAAPALPTDCLNTLLTCVACVRNPKPNIQTLDTNPGQGPLFGARALRALSSLPQAVAEEGMPEPNPEGPGCPVRGCGWAPQPHAGVSACSPRGREGARPSTSGARGVGVRPSSLGAGGRGALLNVAGAPASCRCAT